MELIKLDVLHILVQKEFTVLIIGILYLTIYVALEITYKSNATKFMQNKYYNSKVKDIYSKIKLFLLLDVGTCKNSFL